jgi:hypothetical protein
MIEPVSDTLELPLLNHTSADLLHRNQQKIAEKLDEVIKVLNTGDLRTAVNVARYRGGDGV